MEGKTLYEADSLKAYVKFLDFFEGLINTSELNTISADGISEFYIKKTKSRVDSFTKKNGNQYLNDSFVINKTNHKPMNDYLKWDKLR